MIISRKNIDAGMQKKKLSSKHNFHLNYANNQNGNLTEQIICTSILINKDLQINYKMPVPE